MRCGGITEELNQMVEKWCKRIKWGKKTYNEFNVT